MKKFLFLLLSLAVVATASAGIDRSQLAKASISPQAAKTMLKSETKHNVEVVKSESSVKTIKKFDLNIPGVQLRAPHRAASDVISEQPEGEVKTYARSGYYAEAEFEDSGEQTGYTEIVYAADGETVYIKDIIYGYAFGSWVQGTISGNKITVPLGQCVYWVDNNNYGVIIGWGTASEDYFAYDSSVTEVTFTIDGNTISMDNSSVDMDGKEITGLAIVPDIYTSYLYQIDGNTVFTYDEEFVEPTLITTNDILTMYQNEGGYILEFNRLGYALVGGEATEQDGYGFVYIDANFENAYMMNPVYGRQFNNWMKGTCDENLNLTFPLGQYLSWSSTYYYGAVTVWGTYADDAFVVDPSVTECTFSAYQDEDGYLIYMLDNSSENTGLAYIWSDDQTWAKCLDWNTILYQLTDDPEDVTVVPGSTTADVTWSDKYDAHWNLRYRLVEDNAPYVCGFDSEDEFNAWDIYDQDGDTYNWEYYNGMAISESYNNDTYSALYPDNWLVSPEVKLTGKLKFTYRGMDANYPAEKFTVYVSTEYDGTGIDSFTAISDEITATGTAQEMEIDLSEYNGQVGRIAIRHANVSDQFILVIDDVFVGDPNYVEPEWTVVEDLDETAYTIEGLTPETNYEVQVQSFNGGGASDWTASTYFTTLPAVPTVYMMGEVNEQGWAANAGTEMKYEEENGVYTATVNFDGRGENGENYFGFTYKLADDADAWDDIAAYRFGAVSDGNFWINEDMYGQELSLTRDNGQAFRILAGDYKLTVNTETMKLIVEKIEPQPQGLRGDANDDGDVTIADVTTLIDYLLGTTPEPWNEDNANVNLDDTISIADVTVLIDFLLSGNWPAVQE